MTHITFAPILLANTSCMIMSNFKGQQSTMLPQTERREQEMVIKILMNNVNDYDHLEYWSPILSILITILDKNIHSPSCG